ncbi:MAG: AAA family ATPase, partial [Desulfurococcales archaeon]|nr:AAA family ATPase [Desulfurococcales archaeon]
ARLLRGRGRTLLVLGDRGRGKSFLLGLALALAIHERQAGRVHVVAPSPASAASLYRGLKAGLEALGYGGLYRERLESGYTARLWGPWFSVIHRSPESAEPAPLLVVDEAAAVGVARVRRLSWRSGRVMVASTVHGYEGSGRVLVHVLEADLPRPLARVELGEPIRYRRGDPLEEWVLRAFHLDAEPPSVPPEKALGATCRTVPRGRLGPWDAYTSRLLGVLAQAHYRFEPDYILVALESSNHELIALEAPGGEPVAAADVAIEDPSMEEAARLGLKALSTHAPEAAGLRGARIVRIAVSPPLQRMGLGTRILRCAEAHAAKHGALVVTALFSRHDVLGFWVENGYLVAYISPRYNRATGEKNVCVAKPLAPGARGAVEEASSAFRVRLLLSLQSIYRDLAAERVPLILEATAPSHHRPVALTGDMERRLSEFLAGRLDLEQAFDAVWAAAVDCLASRSPSSLGLTQREATALAARILQGKPLNDVAYTLSTTMSEAHATASQAARRLLEACTAPTGAS